MSKSQDDIQIAVIMAGGSGERFWPLSRQNRPKQLLKLCNETETLLESAIRQTATVFKTDDIHIATTRQLHQHIVDAGMEIPEENIFAEPCKRNTAGCLAYGTAKILAKYKTEAENLTLAVITADQEILESDKFCSAIKTAMNTAQQTGALVTLGIVPTRPETGYGYIELGEPLPHIDGNPKDIEFYRVLRFREKPNEETANDYLETGRFLWNSGMFFWRISSFLEDLNQANPSIAQAIDEMRLAFIENDPSKAETIFKSLESVSIDCALMERAKNVIVTRAEFTWDDIGTWDSLHRVRPGDSNRNVTKGNPVLIDCHDCLVLNEAGEKKRAVSVIGVDNLAVVVSEDAILIVRRDRSQDVRHAVAELKKRGAKQL